MDEHPDSHEGSYGAVFLIPSLQFRAWGSFPASWHGRSATVVFCDGHAIIKKWQNPSTVQPVLFEILGSDWGRGNFGLPFEDIWWVAQRSSERIIPDAMW